MKAEREQDKFKPLVVTFESQEEIDYIFMLVAATTGDLDVALGASEHTGMEIYDVLHEHCSDEANCFAHSGRLSITIDE